MKTLITLCLALSFSFSTRAQVDGAPSHQNVLMQFLANDLGMKNIVLYSLIAKRCTRYLPSSDHRKCQESVSKMITLLDSDILFPEPQSELFATYAPQAFLFVAFKKNLIDILSNPKTTDYLNDVQAELNEFLLGNNPDLNLWTFTLNYYGSEGAAARVLSALCQDTSRARLHLKFLDKAKIRGRASFKQNKELLEKFLETLTMIMDVKPGNLQGLLYPKTARGPLNKNLYHFYVPLYLSTALREKKVDPYMAYVAPMFMTLTYEFVTAASDYRYLLNDPVKLAGQEWKVKDIFAGHQGAATGSGRKDIQELKALQDGFATSVAKTVKVMLAR